MTLLLLDFQGNDLRIKALGFTIQSGMVRGRDLELLHDLADLFILGCRLDPSFQVMETALPFFGASIPGFVGLLTGRGPFSPAFALIPGRSMETLAETPVRLDQGFRFPPQLLEPVAAQVVELGVGRLGEREPRLGPHGRLPLPAVTLEIRLRQLDHPGGGPRQAKRLEEKIIALGQQIRHDRCLGG